MLENLIADKNSTIFVDLWDRPVIHTTPPPPIINKSKLTKNNTSTLINSLFFGELP